MAPRGIGRETPAEARIQPAIGKNLGQHKPPKEFSHYTVHAFGLKGRQSYGISVAAVEV